MKKHKSKIIAGVIIAIILTFIFWYGGDAPGLHGWNSQPEEAVGTFENIKSEKEEIVASEKTGAEEKISESTQSLVKTKIENNDAEYFKENTMVTDEAIGKDKHLTDSDSKEELPSESQDASISDKEHTCTLSVRCDTVLKNIAWISKEKVDIVPKDGIIFAEKTVTFYEGESVFDILLREMKRNKIHIEFENTPIYSSAYIEGIANLYELDCGELSGWMYKVNDWFPNYGCSRYQLKEGDRVEWVYTCDSGVDVGGYYASKGK